MGITVQNWYGELSTIKLDKFLTYIEQWLKRIMRKLLRFLILASPLYARTTQNTALHFSAHLKYRTTTASYQSHKHDKEITEHRHFLRICKKKLTQNNPFWEIERTDWLERYMT